MGLVRERLRGAMHRIESWMRPEAAAAALIAIATTLMLQSTRVFVSYLVFVVDQSQRMTIATIAVVAFALPIFTWLFVRLAGAKHIFTGSIVVLAVARLILQLVEQPNVRLATSGIAMAAWGVLLIIVVASQRRPVAAGLITGFGLDLALRTARGPLDLPWMPGLVQTAVVVLLLALLLYLCRVARETIIERGGNWQSAFAVTVIGPAIALFHTVTGNIAFVSLHTDLSPAGSSALLAGGMILGVLIAVLRLLALNLGAGGGPMAGRFMLFDAIIGGIALSFAWGGDGLALLGIFFVTVTVTEMVLFALAAGDPAESPRLVPASILTTAGLLLQFIVLFIYYTSTGSGLMLAVAWFGLVAGTLVSIFSLSASLRGSPLNIGAYAAPAAAVALLLGGSIVWSLANQETFDPQAEPDTTITAITYNIQSGFSRDNYWDLEATADVIEESGADVVFLQEVSRGWLVTTGNDQMRWLGERLGMPYAWGPASTDDLWGNAVLSRYPIISERVVKYDSTQNLKRSALIVELDLGDGTTLIAISTHLDNPGEASEARSEQVEQLIGLLEPGESTILAGDFNMTPDDPLIESIIAAGLVDAGLAGGATEATSEDGRRIDYVFVTPNLAVDAANVIDTDASDHKPVAVTLTLP